jgi:predicted Zn-dependent protease
MYRLLRVVLLGFLCSALLLPATPAGRPARAEASSYFSFGVKDELELGKKFNALVRSRMPLVDDPEVEGYVRDLVLKIATHIPAQPFPLTISVLQDNGVNAFAAPAGYVFVYSGLILDFDHESELAAVMSHELGHVALRHISKRVENAQMLGIAGMLGMVAGILLGAVGHSPQAGAAVAMGSQTASQSSMLAYSREVEQEADEAGLGFLTESGYSPMAMVNAFEILRRLKWFKGIGGMPTYLSTHPGIEERIGYLKDRIAHMPKQLLARPETDERFLRAKMLLRAHYTDAETALSYLEKLPPKPTCMDILGRAIALGRVSRVAEAKTAYDQAIACAPNDALPLREAGRFYYKLGDFGRAVDFLQRSADKNSRDAMTLGYLGWTLHSAGQKDKGKLYLQRALHELPEDVDLHSVYGRMAGEDGDLFTAYLHLAYAALYQNNVKQTAYNLEKAKPLAKTDDQREELARFETIHKERSEFWKETAFR